jgi:hypothetical protein
MKDVRKEIRSVFMSCRIYGPNSYIDIREHIWRYKRIRDVFMMRAWEEKRGGEAAVISISYLEHMYALIHSSVGRNNA